MRPLHALLLSISTALATITAAEAQPLLIRNSYVVPVSNWAPLLVAKKDLAKHLGQSYVFEPIRYAGTPPMITAIANGELEISNLAYSTLAIAIENAGMDDLRVIADEFRDGVEGYYSQEYMVLADGPIKTVTGAHTPVPYSGALLDAFLPNAERVAAAALATLRD